MPIDESMYRSLSDKEKLTYFFSEAAHFLASIHGYADLLKLEMETPELQGCVPPELTDYCDPILKALKGFLEERDVVVRSMEPLPPDDEAG